MLRSRSAMAHQNFVELLYEYCSSTSCHGLNYVSNNKSKLSNFFWCTLVLIGNTASIFFVFSTVTLYLSKPMSSTVYTHRVDGFRIPEILICIPQRYNPDKLHKYNISVALTNDFEKVFCEQLPELFPVDIPLRSSGQAEYMELQDKYGFETFSALMDELAFTCKDIIFSCKQNFETSFDCCKNATHIKPNDLGSCTLLSAPYQDHFLSDFKIVLKYPLVKKSSDPFIPHLFYSADAFNVIFWPEQNDPQWETASLVAPGSYNFVNLHKSAFISVNNPPKYICREVDPDDSYSVLECIFECIYPKDFDTCPCKAVKGISRSNYSNICDPWSLANCSEHKLPNRSNNDAFDNCLKNCVPSCVQEKYSVKLTSTKLSKQQLLNAWMNDSKVENIVQTYSVLSVAFAKLEITRTEQHMHLTIYTAIANVGGTYGLCLGGSMLTIIHLIVFFFEKVVTKNDNAMLDSEIEMKCMEKQETMDANDSE